MGKRQGELGELGGPGEAYGSPQDPGFVASYQARCQCGAVRYQVRGDPLDAKICHCHTCQTLHGAPMQWAAIFRKPDVAFLSGISHLRFFHSATGRAARILPCKVSCGRCGTPIADEGRSMWLAFPTLFEFGDPPVVPPAFLPSCHIFYGSRVLDMDDGLPKWSGHKERSRLI